ncbi:SMEK domain-containing protein [Mucilaginibacter sp. 14171R-50]|uniref:SMEK domain-containing protein n=1 Tax=Mucilaginibacter sp. 14171R-50 TaxID=2703789 RepID=UPI00138C18FE|nr:SMEK domain-containing protein [Mucilaginibacter sp. 14171R-50]QHS55222.1 SMEK domain-containing protein [Mucilaginibacter sp. 14171R-50]
MNRQKSLTRIAELLGRFTTEVGLLNAANLYDINIHAENVLIPLIKLAYGLDMVNANYTKGKNFSAVDLIDNKNRVAFQVTSTADNEKIKHTLNQFIKHERYLSYDILFVYIIGNKQSAYTGKGHAEIVQDKLAFDKDEHIIDNNDLFKKISGIVSLQQISAIEQFLEEEFSEQKIEFRKKALENPASVKHTEHVYFNLIEANIPETLYIADIAIDREAIIKESWTTEYKLKMDASPRKVLRRAIDLAGLTRIADWHVTGNQLLTFRNLHDPAEPLRNFIDQGTITPLKPKEYWTIDADHQRSFTSILNFSLQQLLSHKAIHYIGEDDIYRYQPEGKIVKQRTVEWKKTKRAKRTVIFELFDKNKEQIVCFRHFSFEAKFNLYDEQWYLSVNPTWSFTSNGYKKSGLAKYYAPGLKRLENNNTIYYGFRFISYCLTHNILSDEITFPYLTFNTPFFDEVLTDTEVVEIDENVPEDTPLE